MNEQEYDNQTLTEYLLGSLPEAEAERFDELCFTDENFADHLKSVENNLIDAYIHNELTGATLEKFKSHYLASPLRQEKINFAKSFQVFAERNLTDTDKPVLSAAGSNSNRKKSGFFSSINIFAIPNPALRWGFAAVGLILITAGVLWFISGTLNRRESETASKPELPAQNQPGALQPVNQNSDTGKSLVSTNENNAPQAPQKQQSPKSSQPSEKLPSKQEQPTTNPVVAFFVLTPPLRDASQIQNLSIPKQAGKIVIQLQLEPTDYPAYRVTLLNQTGSKNLWTSGKLKIKSHGEDRVLNVRFPAALLKSQNYSLVLSGINLNGEAEIVGNYSFRSVLK